MRSIKEGGVSILSSHHLNEVVVALRLELSSKGKIIYK
jgi:hypothetical protein